METSALAASNVDNAFRTLVTTIYNKLMSGTFNDCLENFNYFGAQSKFMDY